MKKLGAFGRMSLIFNGSLLS